MPLPPMCVDIQPPSRHVGFVSCTRHVRTTVTKGADHTAGHTCARAISHTRRAASVEAVATPGHTSREGGMQRLERLSAQADPVARSRQFRAQPQRGAGRRSGGGLSRSLISSLFLLLVRLSLLHKAGTRRTNASAQLKCMMSTTHPLRGVGGRGFPSTTTLESRRSVVTRDAAACGACGGGRGVSKGPWLASHRVVRCWRRSQSFLTLRPTCVHGGCGQGTQPTLDSKGLCIDAQSQLMRRGLGLLAGAGSGGIAGVDGGASYGPWPCRTHRDEYVYRSTPAPSHALTTNRGRETAIRTAALTPSVGREPPCLRLSRASPRRQHSSFDCGGTNRVPYMRRAIVPAQSKRTVDERRQRRAHPSTLCRSEEHTS
jgi:hypothetical protein